MTIQSNVGVAIAYAAQAGLGTPAAVGNGKYIRRVTTNIAPNKESFQSNEVRPDYQVSDLRHGMRSGRGSVEGEISIQTFDDWFEALLGGTWAAGPSAAPAQFATGVTIANGAEANTSTLTFAGAGNLLTLGFKLGQIVRTAGLTNPLNNSKNIRIVGLTATVMTVTPQLVATAQQAAGWSITTPGKTVLMGTTSRYFTIEQIMPDLDISERYTDCRINSANIRVVPNGMCTVSWEVLARDFAVLTGAASPYFTTIADAPVSSIVAGLDGGLRLGGKERAVVTSLDLSISNNFSMQGVIGTPIAPDIFQGRKTVTGNLSAYMEDESLLNLFLNETEADLTVALMASTGTPQDFITLNLQRIKLSSAQHSVAADGGVIAQFAFQGLIANGGAGVNVDKTSISMQRSNT